MLRVGVNARLASDKWHQVHVPSFKDRRISELLYRGATTIVVLARVHKLESKGNSEHAWWCPSGDRTRVQSVTL